MGSRPISSGRSRTAIPVTRQPPQRSRDRPPHSRSADDRETHTVFTGEYRHSVDDKGRVAVPAKFRVQLDGGAFIARWLDACLAIFPKGAWEELAGKVGGLPIGDASARTFSRALFASAYEVEPDRQGRVVLPAGLRETAGLGAEAVLVGARDHAEIWAPERWADYRRAMDAPEAMAEHLSGLGI